MQKQSIGEVRDWLLSHRDELVVRIPKLKELKGARGANSTFPESQEQITGLWKEITKSMNELKASHELEAEAKSLLTQAEAEIRGGASSSSGDQKASQLKVKAFVNHDGGGGTAMPLFWRGCAFGILAAVSSGFGAGGALIACVLVGAFAD